MVILSSNHIIPNHTPHAYGRVAKDLGSQCNKRKRAVTKSNQVQDSQRSLSSNLKIAPQDLVEAKWKMPERLKPLDTPNIDLLLTILALLELPVLLL
jgi:hypothetical protein